MKTTPYLVFQGDAREALTFYADVLGGKAEIMPYSEMPGDMKMPDEMADAVMHGSVRVDDNPVVMATDSVGGMGPKFTYGDSFFVCCSFGKDEDKADKIFDALCDGGKVIRKFEKQFWGDKLGMCVDKFGVYWMIDQAS